MDKRASNLVTYSPEEYKEMNKQDDLCTILWEAVGGDDDLSENLTNIIADYLLANKNRVMEILTR